MKATQDSTYNPTQPEKFNWGLLDSPKLSEIATDFASRIHRETLFIAEERHMTSGLRYALNEIAKIADL